MVCYVEFSLSFPGLYSVIIRQICVRLNALAHKGFKCVASIILILNKIIIIVAFCSYLMLRFDYGHGLSEELKGIMNSL